MNKQNWRPSANLSCLRIRAELYKNIRSFFEKKGFLEVETPLLSQNTVTEPFIESISTEILVEKKKRLFYLQTSPEYAMKRLLAAGSGSIYQISKAFRQGETSKRHNPEFTLLEWYSLGATDKILMDQVDDFLISISSRFKKATRFSYEEIFKSFLGINPFEAETEELAFCAAKHHIYCDDLDRDNYLQILMSTCIEPKLGLKSPCFIYDFPASQAMLAQLNPNDSKKASRFEVYISGMEIGNGFHELDNAHEQRKRFEQNINLRQTLNLPTIDIDNRLLQALEYGLPSCAGIALGLDRLLMILCNTKTIAEVLSFDITRS